ncbi:IPPc [Musa troglodytarum]|uniref:IPPc n=1 Tax=Musa troglodytarum TaxID=320322 RepID=A0A9E7EP80_9LILI|nr:IPPc [Musa troglodytarum]
MALANPTNAALLFFCFLFSSTVMCALCRPGDKFYPSELTLALRSSDIFGYTVSCSRCRVCCDPGGVFSHSSFAPLRRGSRSPGVMTKEEGCRRWRDGSGRRLLIGSTAPVCTYNECRGCRFKCSAEQVPVDAGDPMNSAYHYRCVCHR